ncbi:macrophage migration inhibitory factor-like protein [Novymonas esmeraldas]|uniref:L-dopachrome isomerase n=1 Tax=Novymonas esmeraldas TaxID=1808958 RepID=A0AAW0F8Y7_9TRYP
MPFIHTIVSTPLGSQQRASLSKEYRTICSEVLGKPEEFVMTAFSDNTPIEFQDSAAPAAYIRVESWGDYAPSKPKEVTPRLTAAITAECSIPADRIYVVYVSTQHWGWNGANF